MNRIAIVSAVAALAALSAFAQPAAKSSKDGSDKFQYKFTDKVLVEKTTSVKNQASSGTCWCFSTIGFLENELLRLGKGEHDLSEMFIVRWAYVEKAIKYARMHGTINFDAGGATEDVFALWKKYGIVPDEVYTGLQYGTDTHRHGELNSSLKAYMDAVIKNQNLSVKWLDGFCGILDAYLGEVPQTFEYRGRTFTPKTFADSLGLDMDDYVSFTSFTHHPFYEPFAVEVPDNWLWAESYNLPIDELMGLVDGALGSGYSVAWGADVSEPGFLRSDGTAYALIPQQFKEDKSDSEEARWVPLTAAEMKSSLSDLKEPVAPVEVTQEMRQKSFDNYETTDDHGMLIEGIAEDQAHNKFYRVKNSWAPTYGYDGYLYVSEPFMRWKTLNIAVHKDVIPAALRERLGL